MSLTQASLAALFPSGVHVELATPADADATLLLGQEHEYARRMAQRRLAEFAAGRAVARRALEAQGGAGVPLTWMQGDRDVAWPRGFMGSISHTQGLVAAVVAPTGQDAWGAPLLGLGLDVEGAAPLGDDLVPRICLAEELAALAHTLAPPAGWPKVLFAVKEAAYKAWYPLTRVMLDFPDMRVALDPAGRFTASVRLEGAVQAALDARGVDARGYRIEGRFAWGGEHVAAGAVLVSRH